MRKLPVYLLLVGSLIYAQNTCNTCNKCVRDVNSLFRLYSSREQDDSALNPKTIDQDASLCGIQNLVGQEHEVGSQRTQIAEHPWITLIHYAFRNGSAAGFRCGGSLITARYVVTAGHCVSLDISENIEPDSVRLGEWRLSTEYDCFQGEDGEICADPVINLMISKLIVHPGFNHFKAQHDIALIQLVQDVAYTKYIRPICLPETHYLDIQENSFLTLVRWGFDKTGNILDYKSKIQVPVITNENCSSIIRRKSHPITEYHLCAGGIENEDSCQGDSGCPLLRKVNKNGNFQYFLEGIVSWGLACGIKNIPGVYVRVAAYADWISNNTQY